jgi:hypothetical protein
MNRLAGVLCACVLTAGLSVYAILPASAQSSAEIAPPGPDKVKIVFIRAAQGMGTRIEANLFEIVQDRPEFIGALWAGEKLIHETTAGAKTFMTYGYVGDLVFGDLSGGKIYYVLLRAHPGTGGMIPSPVRAGDDGPFNVHTALVVKGIAEYPLVRPAAAGKNRFIRENDQIQKVYDRTAAKFKDKNSAQIAERTLRPEDAAGN